MSRFLKSISFALPLLFVTACWDGSGGDKKNEAPTAVAAASQPAPDQITTFQFSSSGSTDPEGAPLKYLWTFGDGQTSAAANPTHTYAAGGTFDVDLRVEDGSGASATTRVRVDVPLNALSASVGDTARTIELRDVATLEIQPGTLAAGGTLGLWTTSKAVTAEDFRVTSIMFAEPKRADYEIRVNIKSQRPSKAIGVTAVLPASVRAKLGADDEPAIFAQILQDAGEEVHDQFELLDSTYSTADNRVTFTLLPEMFADLRTADKSWEAVIVVGSAATKPTPAMASRAAGKSSAIRYESPRPTPSGAFTDAARQGKVLRAPLAAATACGGWSLGAPLASLTSTGAFSPPGHYGSDLRAQNGTSVRAMLTGEVIAVDHQVKQLASPHPRSGKMVSGWGHYVVIRTGERTFTLYAHLQDGDIKVKKGDVVNQGDEIALSDNSGGSEAPHLHVEYVPDGKTFYEKGGKVDPYACMGSNVAGAISIEDNGSLADDAFLVSISGTEICKTAIGQANSCVVGALRSGTVTLTVTVLVAPDNVGTYRVRLFEGLKFEDGSTSKEGTAPQGQAVSFRVIVP